MNDPDLSRFRDKTWLQGITLLIAEDDPINYRLLNVMLRNTGVEMIWAKDGAEAVQFFKDKPADEKWVVLMDIKMPVMDGYQAAEIIREMDEHIPLIAVTAYAQTSDRDRIMQSNFSGYISKPIHMNALHEILSKYSL